MEILVAIAILVIAFMAKGFKIVQQSETMVIERLGRYNRTLSSGINIIWPFIDQPRSIAWRTTRNTINGQLVTFKTIERIDLRETVYDFPSQNVITKDNVNVEINALLYFQIMDPVKSVYEIENLPNAIEKLTQTTLRNIIGELELDETLTSRDTINAKLRVILDEATNKWGVKINRVELQDINPPKESKSAMEKLNALTKNCNHPIGYRVNCNDNKLKAKFIELCSLSQPAKYTSDCSSDKKHS